MFPLEYPDNSPMTVRFVLELWMDGWIDGKHEVKRNSKKRKGTLEKNTCRALKIALSLGFIIV